MIEIVVPGKPIAKKRPRFARRGKYTAVINDQETEGGKFIIQCLQQLNGEKPLEGPIALHCCFYMPIPKSTSKKKRALMIDGLEHHTKKPDVDNLVKFVADCLNSIAWHDDRQIVAIRATKIYANDPKTEIFVESV